MKTILFVRKFPFQLAASWLDGVLKTILSLLGCPCSAVVGGHEIIFFFPGYGKCRKIPDSIIDKIKSGEISDIVDVGGGGALNPALNLGDLVLSVGEKCFSGPIFMNLKRRDAAVGAAQKIAIEDQREFWAGKILTSERPIFRRRDRLYWQRESGAVAVQMEHARVLERILEQAGDEAFHQLHFTHLELIIDKVPPEGMTFRQKIMLFLNFLRNIQKVHEELDCLKVKFLEELISSQAGV